MAFKLLSLALVLAIVAQCGLADTGAELTDTIAVPIPPPAFCKGLDCPVYKVLNTTATYEVREYEPSTWITTNVLGWSIMMARAVGLKKLDNYTDGGNVDAVKVNETVPLTISIKAAPGPFGERTYTISKFAPLGYEGEPPAPIDPAVIISKLPGFKAYVNSTAGYKMDEFSIQAMAARLAQDIQLNEGIIVGGDYTFAAYDNFTAKFARHNEVWIVAPSTETNVIEAL